MKEKSVVVSELHPKATEQDVLEMFIYCGPVNKIEIQKGKSAQGVIISNCAVIHYCDAAAAQMALLLSRAIILGKAVQVAEYQEVVEIKQEIDNTNSSISPTITPALPPKPQLTRESSFTKPAVRPSTPTFTPILSSIFSSSPPKPVSYELTTMTRSNSGSRVSVPSSHDTSSSHTPILSSIFASSPPKHIETPLPPRSAPIPIKSNSALANSLSSSSFTSISPSPSPAPSSSSAPSDLSPVAATTPSPQSTPPATSLLDKSQGHKEKSTADELEEILHISEKVETVTALASEIRQKASAEAKIFDEKYSITSKFNLFKAKAISFKNEVLSDNKP